MVNQLPALPAFLKSVSGWGLGAAGKRGIGGASGPHLSIKDNDFTLIEENGQRNIAGSFDAKLGGRYLHAVIVGISEVRSRIFWGEGNKFVAGQENYEPPACFSHDGIKPSIDAEFPQFPTCNLCPQSAWGPAKKPPACQDGKRIVIYVPEKGFYWYRITPGSFKNWQSYLNTLEGQGVEPQYFLTRFQFVSQGVLAFIADAYVTEEMVAAYNKPEQIKRLLKPMGAVVPQAIAIAAFEQPAQIAAPVYQHMAAPIVAPAETTAEGIKRKRSTKAEMEARRQEEVPTEINVPVVTQATIRPAPVFGQETPGIADAALAAALQAAGL